MSDMLSERAQKVEAESGKLTVRERHLDAREKQAEDKVRGTAASDVLQSCLHPPCRAPGRHLLRHMMLASGTHALSLRLDET